MCDYCTVQSPLATFFKVVKNAKKNVPECGLNQGTLAGGWRGQIHSGLEMGGDNYNMTKKLPI